jgi:hypothetical protein
LEGRAFFVHLERMRPILIWGGAGMLAGAVIAAIALTAYSHSSSTATAAGTQDGQLVQVAQQTAGPVQGPAKPQFPHMELQAQYAGPLQDTIIQRWRDPIDGTICYLYLPILVHHSPPTPTGFVEYGGNGVGSISCMAANMVPPMARR